MATYKQTELAAVGKKITSVDNRISTEGVQATRFAQAQTAALAKFNTKATADLAKLNTERAQLISMRDFLMTLPD